MADTWPRHRVKDSELGNFCVQRQTREGGAWSNCHFADQVELTSRLKALLEWAANRAAEDRA